ncbi:MAG: FliG C-terminal domain-containing protein [Planctomycetota bacterium]
MTGLDKVAILFRVLGAEAAEPLCRGMRPEEVARVGAAMVRLERMPPTREQIEEVLEEFQGLMQKGGGIFSNVNETLEQMFRATFGERGAQLLEEVRVNAQVESPFKGLTGIPYSDLERVLREEHPQVQAAVLANIEPQLAAGVLSCFTPEDRADMVKRIATMRPPPPRLLRDLADLFIEKTARLPRYDALEAAAAEASVKRVASILNAGGGQDNSSLFETISGDAPDLVERIRETMFTFEDLAGVDKMTMQKVLGSIDTKLLALSLKACSPPVSDAIFAAVSQRTRDMIAEERELLGAVPLSEVREAQKEIMGVIRGMIESGTIAVSVGGGDAELVE